MQLPSNSLRARYDWLTPRELMNAVVKGLANKQIASELGTAEIALKIQRGRVMKKMDASSLPSLVRMALELEMEPASKPLRMNQTKV
jgi:FixJ family two-component response regulator